ncbi:hypothetical protein [Nonomuraea soli]|uniref:Uncharacterized protein n=1 Tax=Nonomuraea soli TaxID=1032476 RepID=A0A7W0CU44_9ACTN|nr:hypothetical protein [Nonomuraea soli]MBA2897391.1 hypothetical protein [Nonomuraea soli]
MSTALRIRRTAPALLAHTFYEGETPADAAGAVAVTVTDAAGVSVATGDATHAGAGTGRYTFHLAGQAQLALLTVTWSGTIGGSAVTESDQVEIVGGHLFTLVEGRGSDETLASPAKYSTADLIEARQEVEEELERITGRSWTPRYRRLILPGTGTWDLVLPDGGDEYVASMLLRGVRSIRSAGIQHAPGAAVTPLSAGELAALAVAGDGQVRRTDGRTWTSGVGNVVIEYEYGSDAAPADLVKAALVRFRSRLNIARSGVPDRAISFQVTEGGTYRLSTPSADRTGIPEVDAVYHRYARGAGGGQGGGPAPASRTLDYTPQHRSLFHGGHP